MTAPHPASGEASRILLGLGGTVDYEVTWDADALAAAAQAHGITPADLEVEGPIVGEREFVVSILRYLRAGAGGERFVESASAIAALAERFEVVATLGGTSVRAALAMARIGVPSTLHLVSIDDHVRRGLPASIAYLCSATQDSLHPHLIVQFPRGARIVTDALDVVAPQANRLIYVNDPDNRDLRLSPDLPAAIARADVVLLSSFNAMLDEGLLTARLDAVEGMVEAAGPGRLTVYEDACYHRDHFAHVVRARMAGLVDVFSLSEEELTFHLGEELDLLDVDAVLEAVQRFSAMVPAPIVVLHSKMWALAWGAGAAGYRKALRSGVSLASARYVHGDALTREDYESMRATPAPEGLEPFATTLAGRADERGVELVCVPVPALQVERPTTVGLGDTFIGGFLAAVRR